MTAYNWIARKISKTSAMIQVGEHANAVLHTSTQAVAKILERRAELDRQGRHHEPLVVLAGEVHPKVAHYAQHMAVIKKLADAEPSLVVYREHQHDFFAHVFRNNLIPPINKMLEEVGLPKPQQKTVEDFIAKQTHTALPLRLASTFYKTVHAPYANTVFSNFLLKNKIRAFFNDAARTPKYDDEKFLDNNDPSTRDALMTCFGNAASGIELTSSTGMYARNHHMVNMILSHSAPFSPRIIFQQCGKSHVAGTKIGGHPATQSLSSLLKKANIPVMTLSLLTSNSNEQDIPHDHDLQLDEQISIAGLPEVSAIYSITGKTKIPDTQYAEFQNREAEAKYLDAILRKMGMQHLTLTPEQNEAFDLENLGQIVQEFVDYANKHDPGIKGKVSFKPAIVPRPKM